MSIGLVIGYIGVGLALIAQIWLAVTAFRKGVLWGLAVLCIPFVALVFVILNFRDTKGALVMYVLGLLLMGGGSSMVRRAQRMELLRQESEEEQPQQ